AEKAIVYTSCLKPGQFVLTFDDGPNPETTPIALEVLEKYNIKGTFFINAINWSNLIEDPSAVETVRKTYAAGHDIGSHTYRHKDLYSAIEDNTLKENVDDMTELIESIIGVRPAYFRPPSGIGGYIETDPQKKEMSEMIQEYLGDRGYSIIMWGTDTRDWQYKEDVDMVIETLNEQLANPKVSPKTHSFITLLHDVHPTTVNIILPAVIEYVQSLGYTFVSLSECIGVSPYQSVAFEGNGSQNLNSNSNTTTTDSNTDIQNNNNNNNSQTNINTQTNSNNNSSSNNTETNNPTNNVTQNSSASTLQYSLFITICSILLSLFL
ncbi:glycoside hydrolase/deacetylase, partial [Piromyces finnis]